MARYLCCTKCGEEFAKAEQLPGERFTFKIGHALRIYLCDLCNVDIIPGDRAYALSVHGQNFTVEDWADGYLSQIEAS